MYACTLSHFSHVRLFATLWTVAHLSPWDSPGKNTGVGCHALLQRIFQTQGSNLSLLAGRFFTIKPRKINYFKANNIYTP